MSIITHAARLKKEELQKAIAENPFESGTFPERNIAMSIDILNGSSLEDAGAKHGLSRERTRQILSKVIRHALKADKYSALLKVVAR